MGAHNRLRMGKPIDLQTLSRDWRWKSKTASSRICPWNWTSFVEDISLIKILRQGELKTKTTFPQIRPRWHLRREVPAPAELRHRHRHRPVRRLRRRQVRSRLGKNLTFMLLKIWSIISSKPSITLKNFSVHCSFVGLEQKPQSFSGRYSNLP